MRLIVGLGNPGRLYVNNRHNLGFKCLDFFAREQGIRLRERRAKAHLGLGKVGGEEVVLAKPHTFMNLSGQAIAALVKRYSVSTADLVVIYDDLALPLGRIRIRERGRAGGHNGMKSIIAHLGSQDFPRIRAGIAPVAQDISPPQAIEYVLSDFTAEEKTLVQEVQGKVAAALYCLISEGLEAAMNRFN